MSISASSVAATCRREDLSLSTGQRNLMLGVSLLLLLASPFWVWSLFFAGNYEFGSALIFVPLLCLINFLLIFRITKQTPVLGKLMLVSYAMKIASSGGYMTLLFVYYVKGADASTYYSVGKQWAAYFSAHGDYPIVGHVWGTSFLNLVAAILINLIGPTFPTINVLFASAAFWGIYFFYAAFREAFPAGRKEFGALLLFLLPSCQFWNAALGKDALMMLSIGMVSYGFAELLSARLLRGFSFMLPAMALGALTRPHVIGIVAIAIFLAYTFRKGNQGTVASLARLLGTPAMAFGVWYLVTNATQLLNVDSAAGGLERIEKLGSGTMHGGSSFGAAQSAPLKLLLSPFLMFRPFPWEIPNPLALLATVEALVILYFLWRVRVPIARMLRHWSSEPFVTYVVSFGVIFSAVFSLALSNFGLLIRQRTQFTPLLLILIASVWPLRRTGTS
jgi:hypothetical protein